MQLGPVEYIVVAFPGSRFTGEIAPALADLVESGTIRVIDLAFVSKDDDGKLQRGRARRARARRAARSSRPQACRSTGC